MSGNRYLIGSLGGQYEAVRLSGTVVDITTSGTAVVLPTGVGPMTPTGFTFDKLENYSGQSANAYGVSVGTSVEYELEGGRISKVRVVGKPHRS